MPVYVHVHFFSIYKYWGRFIHSQLIDGKVIDKMDSRALLGAYGGL